MVDVHLGSDDKRWRAGSRKCISFKTVQCHPCWTCAKIKDTQITNWENVFESCSIRAGQNFWLVGYMDSIDGAAADRWGILVPTSLEKKKKSWNGFKMWSNENGQKQSYNKMCLWSLIWLCNEITFKPLKNALNTAILGLTYNTYHFCRYRGAILKTIIRLHLRQFACALARVSVENWAPMKMLRSHCVYFQKWTSLALNSHFLKQ